MTQHFKPWLSFADQINLLESRGMVFADKQQAEYDLARMGYYRLSGYFYPFRQHLAAGGRSDCFVAGTRFDDVVALYQFDNAIKLLALEAIQYIEIAMRTQIAYTLGQQNPIAHTDPTYFNAKFNHAEWFKKYKDLRDSAKDEFVKHNLTKYGELPIWVACEIWDFGAMSKLYKGMTERDQRKIEKHFQLFNKELGTHLHAFNIVRNIAAHHGRLWNKHNIGIPRVQFLADKRNPQWRVLVQHSDHVFTTFCLMQRMLNVICPQHDWGKRFQAALTTFPHNNAAQNEVHLDKMGLGGLNLDDIRVWQLWAN